MQIIWMPAARADLVRVHDFLAHVAPDAAARVLQRLGQAPFQLVEFPRLGERLDAYSPREVRRIMAGKYEIRYEIADATIFVLRLWHTREARPLGGD